MSRIAEYTAGAKWRGTVTLREPLFLVDALAIEEAQERAAVERGEGEDMKLSALSRIHLIWLPVVVPLVEKWELSDFPEGVTVATFPGSPRLESIKLVSWLIHEVMEIYERDAEQVDPNGSGLPLTARQPETEQAAS